MTSDHICLRSRDFLSELGPTFPTVRLTPTYPSPRTKRRGLPPSPTSQLPTPSSPASACRSQNQYSHDSRLFTTSGSERRVAASSALVGKLAIDVALLASCASSLNRTHKFSKRSACDTRTSLNSSGRAAASAAWECL